MAVDRLPQRLDALVAALVALLGLHRLLESAPHLVGVDDAVADEEQEQNDQAGLETQRPEVVVELMQEDDDHLGSTTIPALDS